MLPMRPTPHLSYSQLDSHADQQLRRALAAAPIPYRLVLTLMRESGLSSAEILALNCADVVLTDDTAQLRIGHNHHVTLSLQHATESIGALRLHLHSRHAAAADTPLFCSQRGRRCSYDALHYHWARACQSCGMTDARGRPLIGLQQLTNAARTRADMPESTQVDHPTALPAAPDAPIPLTMTKLLAPAAQPNRVQRERLLARLDEALSRRLLLISAPAGAGKTILLSDWIAHRVIPVAWFALDEADNDPAHFWAYLSAALASQLPAPLLLAAQRGDSPPDTALFPTLLINALVRVSSPILLVLDDYHRITNLSIHQALDWFLERLPGCLHVVIASRHDPPLALARLRVRGELAELRMADLAFTEEESHSFLSNVMGLTLDQALMTQLWAQSEGWIAGLQLAALAARGQIGSPTPQPQIAGSQRLLADYLGDEVLRQLPDGMQRFLLQTAHLDRFCASLCDAVLGYGEATVETSQSMLLALERANLFLLPLDQEQRWYRYHHLFAEMLRSHPLQRAETSKHIHRQAAHWYADAGLHDEAITHALLANDYVYATTLIAPIADIRSWTRGDVLTLLGWLEQIPASILQHQPVVLQAQAWALVATRQFTALDRLLTQLEHSMLPASLLDPLELVRLRVVASNMHGNPTGAIAIMQAMQTQLAPGNEDMQAAFAIESGMALRTLGDIAAAQAAFETAARLSQQAHNPIRTLLAYSHLGALQSWQGQLHKALATFQYALQSAHDMPAAGMVDVWLGRVLYEWGDLTSAEATIRRGLARGTQWWSRDIQMAGIGSLARVLAARQDIQGLITLYDDAQLLALRYNLPWPAAVVTMFLVQVYATLGDLPAAMVHAERLRTMIWQASDGFGRVGEIEIIMRVRLLLARQEQQQALRTLVSASTQVPGGGSHAFAIECALLTVQSQLLADNFLAAGQALDAALTLAAPEGYVQLFLNDHRAIRELLIQRQRQRRPNDPLRRFTEQILRIFPQPKTTPAAPGGPALIEPLREREREILALLAAGHATQAIADQLILSAGTVKWHLQNIYAKLQVRSRTQAIARAHELGIL